MSLKKQTVMVNKTAEQWRVADLSIDTGRMRVTRGDQVLELSRLSFDLLLALVRAAPNVLSNEDLMHIVWPNLVVSPETVVTRVKLLRNSLEDTSSQPRYIASLRGRGYSIIPAVELIQAGTEEEPAGEKLRSPKPLRSNLATWIAAAGLLLVCLWLVNYFWVGTTPTVPSGSDAVAEKSGNFSVAVGARDRTIAVLPFQFLGSNMDRAFIAQAIPDAVLDRLAGVPDLRVIGHYSAAQADAVDDDAQTLGERLLAGYLLRGTVQNEADKLRVTVRLVASDGAVQLWSHSFDSSFDELFNLQDKIASELATQLQLRLGGLQAPESGPQATEDINAYLAYLRGRALLRRYTVTDVLAAAEQFERAAAADEKFAAAHAALFDARMQAASLLQDNLSEARRQYRPILDRAMSLDPHSAGTVFVRALWDEVDDDERERLFREVVRMDPSNSRALTVFSEFLDYRNWGVGGWHRVYGFPSRACLREVNGCQPPDPAREALAQDLLEQAIAVDPLSPRAYYRQIGRQFTAIGASIEQQMQELLNVDPQFYPALVRVGKYRWLLHDSPSEAIAITEKAVDADPPNPWGRNLAVAYYLDLDDPAAAEDAARGSLASQETAAVVLALYRGDARTAGLAAENDRSFVFGFNESWGSAVALRDAAMLSGDYAGAERILRQRFDMQANGPIRIRVENHRSYVTLAHLLSLQGKTDAARAMLQAAVDWIDSNPRFGTVYMLRTRAEAQMLLGNREQAMKDLRNAFLQDRDHTEWWYTLRRNPVWQAVRDDPVFAVIEADINAFLTREKLALEELRRSGEVPLRPAAAPGAEDKIN